MIWFPTGVIPDIEKRADGGSVVGFIAADEIYVFILPFPE